jgi:hypothetical protein
MINYYRSSVDLAQASRSGASFLSAHALVIWGQRDQYLGQNGGRARRCANLDRVSACRTCIGSITTSMSVLTNCSSTFLPPPCQPRTAEIAAPAPGRLSWLLAQLVPGVRMPYRASP